MDNSIKISILTKRYARLGDYIEKALTTLDDPSLSHYRSSKTAALLLRRAEDEIKEFELWRTEMQFDKDDEIG